MLDRRHGKGSQQMYPQPRDFFSKKIRILHPQGFPFCFEVFSVNPPLAIRRDPTRPQDPGVSSPRKKKPLVPRKIPRSENLAGQNTLQLEGAQQKLPYKSCKANPSTPKQHSFSLSLSPHSTSKKKHQKTHGRTIGFHPAFFPINIRSPIQASF